MYLVAAALYVRAAIGDGASGSHARWFGAVGVVVHGLNVMAGLWTGHVGFAQSLSLGALGIMAIVVVVVRDRLAAVAALLAPVAVALQTASLFAPSPRVVALDTVGGSWWLPVHLGLVFAAVAGFFLEFSVSAMQEFVRRRLKNKQLSGLSRFPSLDVLDRVQFRSMVFGLGALGLGIAAGALWASTAMHHESWVSDPKVWFTAIVWVWYAVVLQLRVSVGWHGRWSVWLSAVGFAGLIFSWVGLDFITQGFHAYGG